ncbi:MAG TPA: tetratricopeptide repeat protein [Polyangia bacterium]
MTRRAWLRIAAAVSPVGLAAPAPAAPCVCPCPTPQPGATGSATLTRTPTAEAFAKNRAGYAAYRERRFAEARGAYQAALDADPTFLAPRLNIACALVQEERFADAVAAAAELAHKGFVPWGREIEEAADLAPLRIRPEFRSLQGKLAEAGRSWGAALFARAPALPFVARTGPPVGLAGKGVLVLSPEQEVFAYLPDSGTYRQLTNEDGRVLAIARSADGRQLVYVRGAKLIRQDGAPDSLRGLVVRRLSLSDMTLGPAVAIPGDVERLGLGFHADSIAMSVRTSDGSERHFAMAGGQLVASAVSPPARPQVVLTAKGIAAMPRTAVAGTANDCRFVAEDEVVRPGGLPRVIVRAGKQRFALDSPHGAGLHGLSFDSGRAPPKP